MDAEECGWLDAARRGDEDGFRFFVRRYQDSLYNYVFRMVHREADAEDLVQEAFVKAFRALDRYDPRYAFSTWLFRIAHNCTVDRLRRRRPVFESIDDHVIIDDAPTPDQAHAGQVRRELVGRALAALPDQLREVLVLFHLEERTYDEIAAVLGVPKTTVKTRLHRARRALKEKLKPLVRDPRIKE